MVTELQACQVCRKLQEALPSFTDLLLPPRSTLPLHAPPSLSSPLTFLQRARDLSGRTRGCGAVGDGGLEEEGVRKEKKSTRVGDGVQVQGAVHDRRTEGTL